MATHYDWQSQNHEQLFDQAMMTVKYLSVEANQIRMGFGPYSAQVKWLNAEFFVKYEAFKAAFENWRNEAARTKIILEQLRETEKVFRAVYRQLYTGFLKKSPLVTDDDLIAMSLPKRYTGRGVPSPIATTYPECYIDTSIIRRLIFHFFDQSKFKSKAKPFGQHGVEIRWVILTAPPKDIDELTNSSLSVKTPFMLEFGEKDRGKTVYFCLRWENTRGEKGPWSEIHNAIIP
ncbi:MAG: hypothetical protein LBF88_01750 [Planctomycetaceae bacterium]|jgi:hypothetical protein|nr:hypothetical protein [Planctomycetaceae bacterium]